MCSGVKLDVLGDAGVDWKGGGSRQGGRGLTPRAHGMICPAILLLVMAHARSQRREAVGERLV